MHGENTGDAFSYATRDVHNPILLKQMSYIKPLSEEATLGERDKEGEGGEGEEKRRNKGMIREAF